MCVAVATHNIKWRKINHVSLIWDQTFADLDVYRHISSRITDIQPAKKTDLKGL